MDNEIYLNQQAEALRRYGYSSFSNPEFAGEVMAALPKPEFAKVKHIFGTGTNCVGGYIYLPKGRRHIAAEIRRTLRESKQAIASNTRALAALNR
mgnify:CR=1 FL=1|jgi:hypothetical protein